MLSQQKDVDISVLTHFSSLSIIRRVGKAGKLGRDGQPYRLEYRRKMHHLAALRTME